MSYFFTSESVTEEHILLQKIKKILSFSVLLFFLGGNNVCAENSDAYSKKFRVFSVNSVFSVGEACRPANYLKKYGLRFQSSPLDWMFDYTLEIAAHLFETKFQDFFEEIEEIPNKFKDVNRYVRDVKNGIMSIHHFNRFNSLKDEHIKFRSLMLERARKLDEIFRISNSIGFISNRKNESVEDIISFLKEFSDLYSDKFLVFFLVSDEKIEGITQSIVFEDKNSVIVKFSFSDVKPENEEFVDYAGGNPYSWEKVANCFKLDKSCFEK